MACKTCNDCMTQEQVINLINSLSNPTIPTGLRSTVGLSDYNAYFDASGLGFDVFDGWAVSNGSNGTSNRLGKMLAYYRFDDPNFGTVDATGGATSVTLVEANLPAHAHNITDPGHTHTVTDAGHTHTGTTDTGLATPLDILDDGAAVVSVTGTVGDVTLDYVSIDDPGATSPTIDVLSSSTSSHAADGTDTTSVLNDNMSVSISNHDHPDLNASHTHTFTTASSTTSLTVDSGTTGISIQNTGSGTSFDILPPFIVEVPIEKI